MRTTCRTCRTALKTLDERRDEFCAEHEAEESALDDANNRRAAAQQQRDAWRGPGSGDPRAGLPEPEGDDDR